MKIQLSDHFNYSRLIRFVLPSIIMMICASVYSIVDGLFVSNFVGKTPFAAINLIMPVLIAMGTIGFMMGTGGSAIVSKTLGEGKKDLANQYFSLILYVTAAISILFSIIGVIFIRPLAIMLGAEGEMVEFCVIYGRILLASQPAFILQNMFQSFMIVAQKPMLNLKISIAAGLTNVFFDFLFIVVFKWGIAGAAVATAFGQIIGGVIPLIIFIKASKDELHLTKAPFNGRILFKACTNGSSELLTNLSASVVTILYNAQLMSLAGENGVAAYGTIMYVNFIFAAIFIGYSIGTAPIISFNYGSANHTELKNLFKKSLIIIALSGITMTILAQLSAVPLTKVFVGYDAELRAMTCRGFRIYSISFLLCGFNAFGSSFFTALNNGVVSAVISFLRTCILQIAAVMILPIFLEIDGIWLAIIVAESVALMVTVFFFVTQKYRYKYI